jgi:hypothetical protein
VSDLWESKLRYRNLADPGVFGGEIRVAFDPAESLARDIQVCTGSCMARYPLPNVG